MNTRLYKMGCMCQSGGTDCPYVLRPFLIGQHGHQIGFGCVEPFDNLHRAKFEWLQYMHAMTASVAHRIQVQPRSTVTGESKRMLDKLNQWLGIVTILQCHLDLFGGMA